MLIRVAIPSLLLLFRCAVAAPTAKDFDEYFTGSTLRVDYFHAGTAEEEHFALDRVRVEGPWPGSRTRLVDDTNLGHYLVEIADAATNRVLYSRGFSSIFGEWRSTEPARAGDWGVYPEAVRVPEPKRAFQLRIRKRQPDQSFGEVWTVTIDPESRFVDRPTLSDRNVWTVVENGEPAVKADLLFLGDGYTPEQMPQFHDDVKRLADAVLAAEPFASRKSDFNVRAVDTPAAQSGITRPRGGAFRESPLAMRYNTFDSERYVLTLNDRAWRDAASAAPYDFVIMLVNERQYGGGGIFNLYATASARSAFAEYLVVHEFGHHFAALADEYFTSPVAYEEETDSPVEPWEPNVTALNDPAGLKWQRLVTQGVPLPTPWNKSDYEQQSREFQEQRKKLRESGALEEELEMLFRREREHFTRALGAEPHAGCVGAFEGARYTSTGLYRPSVDCLMFSRDEVGFCAVCRQAIERIIDLYSR